MFTNLFRRTNSPRAATTTTTKFMQACFTGDDHTIIQLLQKEPSLVNYHDKLGQSGLSVAAEYGHPDCVRTLLSNHANPNYCWSEDPTKNVFHPLITACHNEHVACVMLLLKAGADPNAVSGFGTPLELLALLFPTVNNESIKRQSNVLDTCLMLFEHSNTPLIIRTPKEMAQQHKPEEIKQIHIGIRKIHEGLKQALGRVRSQMTTVLSRTRSTTKTSRTIRKNGSRRSRTTTLKKKKEFELSWARWAS